MKNTLYLLIALTFIQNITLAQRKNPIQPMHKFMQANADSTLVFEFTTNWFSTPAYYLLSKQGSNISTYTYKNFVNMKSLSGLPKEIAAALIKNQVKIIDEPVDINVYFNPYTIPNTKKQKFWNDVAILKPWTLKDDAVEGTGCPPTKVGSTYTISDGGGIQLYLITKDQIKILDFYAPEYYEKHSPGRPGRAAINKISKLFVTNFKIWQ